MVSLHDLPVELLSLIFAFVAERKDDNMIIGGDDYDDLFAEIDDLQNLCLTSHKLREIAQPILFREFEDDDIDGDLKKTIMFARTLYRRPDLAKHVQSVAIAPLVDREFEPDPIDPEDKKLFTDAIKDLQPKSPDTWIKSMTMREFNVFILLVANITSNLRKLTVPHSTPLIREFNQLFELNPSFLSNLEEFWSECDDILKSKPMGLYENIFRLPKLKSFTFEYGWLTGSNGLTEYAPGSLSIEKFFLRQCHFDADTIHNLMKACKKVKHFMYSNFLPDQRPRLHISNLPAEFTAPQVLEAALLHKDTLEHFHVDFHRGQAELEDRQKYLSSRIKFGSFRDFSVLETIVVPFSYLKVHPQLPSSLKMLVIGDCNLSIRNMAQNIAKDCKKGLYPHLTTIKVLTVDPTFPIKLAGQVVPPGKTPHDCFLELQNFFKGTNVDFRIAPFEMPDPNELIDSDDEDDEDGIDDFDDLDGDDGFGPDPMPGMGEMPGLFDMIMRRALQDPDFAHLRPAARAAGDISDHSWETDEED